MGAEGGSFRRKPEAKEGILWYKVGKSVHLTPIGGPPWASHIVADRRLR